MRAHRVQIPVRVASLIIASILAIGACSSSGSEPTTGATVGATGTPPGGTPAATATPTGGPDSGSAGEVTIAGFAFAPASITVTAGTTVTWANEDAAPHTATADDGSFDSGRLSQGGTFSMTFESAGTYAYHCAIHPAMTATIVVTE